VSNKQWESMIDSAKRWGILYTCAKCSSENVSKLNGWTKWDVLSQSWRVVLSVKDDVHWCNDCHTGVDVLIETVNIGEYEDESVT